MFAVNWRKRVDVFLCKSQIMRIIIEIRKKLKTKEKRTFCFFRPLETNFKFNTGNKKYYIHWTLSDKVTIPQHFWRCSPSVSDSSSPWRTPGHRSPTGSTPGYPEVCQHKNTIKAMDPDPGEKKLKEKTEKCMDIGSNF